MFGFGGLRGRGERVMVRGPRWRSGEEHDDGQQVDGEADGAGGVGAVVGLFDLYSDEDELDDD